MSSNDVAVKVEHLSKRYRIGLKEEMHDSIGSAMLSFFKSPLKNYRKYRSLYRFDDMDPNSEFDSAVNSDSILWALRDVSFEVNRGEVLGIIGNNGAGKSTLLKILSRITDPTSGRATIHGKVSSLLEVGTGFHPELTGRENIYLNGTVLGMRKSEVEARFDQIVDFSGVKKFLDTPVKRYSSGMKVRLAFAIPAHMEPEILIIDEVLAVGDAEFQKKCLAKMQDFTKGGRTILFVSHNMGAVIDLCPRSLLLQDGTVVSDGPSKDIVEEYLSKLFSPVDNQNLGSVSDRRGDGRLRFVAANLHSKNGKCTRVPISGRPIDIILDFFSNEDFSDVQFVLTVFNQRGVAVTNCHVKTMNRNFQIAKGSGRIICRINKLPLPLGNYKIAIAAHDGLGNELDGLSTACIFDVETSNFFGARYVPPMRYSTVLVDHTWELVQ